MDVPARQRISKIGLRVSAWLFAACVAVLGVPNDRIVPRGDPVVWFVTSIGVVCTILWFSLVPTRGTLHLAVLAFYGWSVARALAYLPAWNAMALYGISSLLLWHVYRCVRLDLPRKRQQLIEA